MHVFTLTTLSYLLQATKTDSAFLKKKRLYWNDVWKFTESKEQGAKKMGTRVISRGQVFSSRNY